MLSDMHFLDLYTFDENETTALDTYDRIIECYESLFAELSLDTVKGQYVMILLFCLFSVPADLKLFVEMFILLQVFFYVWCKNVCDTCLCLYV